VRASRGLSQAAVASAARIDRSTYSRIERGVRPQVDFMALARIAAVLGLDIVVKTYPAGRPIRDAGHAKRLAALVGTIRAPLRARLEVPLPRTEERPEYRAWDAVVWGNGQRTAIELETRLYDVQAQLRAINLKRRDDPPDRFLLVLADTRTNRRIVADYPELFAELPRVRKARVVAALGAGVHPPSGVMFW